MTTVSLVMATCDKREYLALTLASLTVQTHPDFEVVLCDDGTRGGVADLVDQYRDRLDLHLVIQENRGRAAARNAALAQAGGDLVVFIDDDRMADPGFVAAHVRAAAAGTGVIGWKRRALTWWRPGRLLLGEQDLIRTVVRAGGRDRLAEPLHLLTPEALTAAPEAALAGVDLGEEPDNHHAVVDEYGPELEGFRFAWALATTANLAVPRAAVEDAGGFDEAYTGWGLEDTDLSYRLHRAGLRFRLEPAAVNHHQIHPLAGPDPQAAHRVMRAQLMQNLDRFCDRHRTLAAYLYRRRWQGALTLPEADRLLATAETDPLLTRELTALYAEA
ncbi:glycosyltransferase [Glycomyces sp. NPDC046736]|uniref:glycosyltransferase family 2 protein n=1 Tax=Glycomyces sp. NPDC046736 TaxID=3155615 RepID=UPI00340973B2